VDDPLQEGTWKSETVGMLVENSKGCEVVTQAPEKHGADQCVDDNHAKTAKTIADTLKAEDEKNTKLATAKALYTAASEAEHKNTEQAIEKANADADQHYNESLIAATAAAVQTWKSENDPKFQAAKAEKEANLKELLATKSKELSTTMNEATEAAGKAYTAARKDIDPELEEKHIKNKADCAKGKNCCCKQTGQNIAMKVPNTFAFSQCDTVMPYAEAFWKSSSCHYYNECEQCVKKMCVRGNCADEGLPQ
jgi:hypothetical protein